MKLEHIKEWYEQNKERTPLTLDAKHIFYSNFNKTFEEFIYVIEFNINKYGPVKCRKMQGVLAAVNFLENAILHVEYTGVWNAKPRETKEFAPTKNGAGPGIEPPRKEAYKNTERRRYFCGY